MDWYLERIASAPSKPKHAHSHSLACGLDISRKKNHVVIVVIMTSVTL